MHQQIQGYSQVSAFRSSNYIGMDINGWGANFNFGGSIMSWFSFFIILSISIGVCWPSKSLQFKYIHPCRCNGILLGLLISCYFKIFLIAMMVMSAMQKSELVHTLPFILDKKKLVLSVLLLTTFCACLWCAVKWKTTF